MANRNWSKQTQLKRLVETMQQENRLDRELTIDDVINGHADDELEVLTALDIVDMLKAAIVKEAIR